MEKLTLSQWTKDNGQTLFMVEGCLAVRSTSASLWNLEDFKVSSISGPTVYLSGYHCEVKVRTREDFNKLSFYTLCRISDTLNTASIEGMVNAIEKGRIRGILITDYLGNFLVIE